MSILPLCFLVMPCLVSPSDDSVGSGPIVQQAYLKASNTDPDDRFGHAIAVSGDTIVVGARLESSNASKINGDETNNSFQAAGAAYVLVREGGEWRQQAYLKASNPAINTQFGHAVAICSDTIAVGSMWEGNRSGAVYIFVRDEFGAWSQQAYLKASNADPFDEFGWAVSLSGDTLIVGARSERSNATGVNGDEANNSATGAGAAYVFVRNGSIWSQQAYLKASNTGPNDRFGYSVSLSGDIAVVGAPNEQSAATGIGGDQSDNSIPDAGAAYLFVREGEAWTQRAYVKASNTNWTQWFGGSLSISGDRFVVGASLESSAATGVNGDQHDLSAQWAGAAYVFVRDGDSWEQEAYLKASNTEAHDRFGYSVAICGDAIAAGALHEASSASGVNGDEHDNGAPAAGAVYLFTRAEAGWSQIAYVKASNPDADDRFGHAVAISDSLLAVGAPRESSSSTGVGGDQLDNSATWSGAAYVLGPRDSDVLAFCFGDGTGASCPCGNEGGPGQGCTSSGGAGSALGWTGSASIGANDLVLIASNIESGTFGLFFQSSSTLGGGQGTPFGNGLQCANGLILRLELEGAQGPSASTSVSIAAAGGVGAGDTRYYQYWYRDSPGPCGEYFNFSSAVRVIWKH